MAIARGRICSGRVIYCKVINFVYAVFFSLFLSLAYCRYVWQWCIQNIAPLWQWCVQNIAPLWQWFVQNIAPLWQWCIQSIAPLWQWCVQNIASMWQWWIQNTASVRDWLAFVHHAASIAAFKAVRRGSSANLWHKAILLLTNENAIPFQVSDFFLCYYSRVYTS